MSKNLPLTTIKQASDENLIKLITENTLTELDDKPALLTLKEKDTLVEEANKRGFYRLIKLHYDLATVVRFLRVDLDSQTFKNKWIIASMERTLEEYENVAGFFTRKWLKPQDDSQAKYRDLVIKEIAPYIGDGYKKDLFIDPWEFTAVKIKQYLLEIRKVGELIKYPILTEDTKKLITQTRYVFYVQSGQLLDTIDELIHDYKTSTEFKAWLQKAGGNIDTFKEAKRVINRYHDLPKEESINLYGAIKQASNRKITGKDSVYLFFENYPYEEIGLNEKQKAEVTKFIDQVKERYGITE